MYTYLSGTVYDGEWKDGKKHGRGAMTFGNGDKYDGEWKRGKEHGGVWTSVEGDTYDGESRTAHGTVAAFTRTPTATSTTARFRREIYTTAAYRRLPAAKSTSANSSTTCGMAATQTALNTTANGKTEMNAGAACG